MSFATRAVIYTVTTQTAFPEYDVGVRRDYSPYHDAIMASDYVARAEAWTGRAGQDLTASLIGESNLLRDIFGPSPSAL